MDEKDRNNVSVDQHQEKNNIETSKYANEATPSRVVVRVKRRRSRSPVEALLLTEGVGQSKRAKTGHANDFQTKDNKETSKLKIFRFTATLQDEKDESTEELVAEMLKKTKAEIIEAKKHKNLVSTSDSSSRKSLKASRHSAIYPSELREETFLQSLMERSAQARYRVNQSKRQIHESDSVDDRQYCTENSIKVSPSNSEASKNVKEVADLEDKPKVEQEIKAFYKFYDLEIDEEYQNDLQSSKDKNEKSSKRIFKRRPKSKVNEKTNKEEDVITCNEIQSVELKESSSKAYTEDSEYVYDLYCHINQEGSSLVNNSSKPTSVLNHNVESAKGLDDTEEGSHVELVPLPDFQSTFSNATANIVGCDWKSAQEYLATDLGNDGMPSWWHRGGEIERDIDFDSEDSNAEDNWRNEYPDEIEDEGDYGIERDGEESDNDIYGFDALNMNDLRDSEEKSDEDQEELVYALSGDVEFNTVSNRHGSAYASYKRKMQHFLGEIDDESDINQNSSDDSSANEDF